MRLSILLFVLFSLVGCASTKPVALDNDIAWMASSAATANACSDMRDLPIAHAREMNQMAQYVLTQVEYSEATYRGAYNHQMDYMYIMTDEDADTMCDAAKTTIPNSIVYLKKKFPVYTINPWWTLLDPLVDTLDSVSEDAQALGRNAQEQADKSRSRTSSSTGSGNEGGSRNVLINTDDGLVQCTVTPSGYTFCN